MDLEGKGALVTGASGGIGGAIARALHGAGARVALSGTNVERLESAAAALGERSFVVPANLGDTTVVAGLIEEAEKAVGTVDVLVNNAGLTRDNLAMRMKDEDWDDVLAVNLTAAFRLSRDCLRGMLKRRWGRIVGITSVVGATGNPGQANYAASKAGLAGLTKALAYEVAARGVTVNCVAPGFIKTPMTDVLTEQQKAVILERVPVGRLGAPEEVAEAVAFLASDGAAYITGQTIHVNGGLAMLA